MTVAAFLNSSHYYTSIADVDDVQDIIDALGTILKTTNDPVWTEPTAGTFKSPVDAYGRYYTVAVSRVDVDTLQLVVADQYATTIRTTRIDINASGSPAIEVKVYSGQYHLWIDVMKATPENFRSGIIDLSPQAQNAIDTKVYTQGHRTSAGTVSSGGTSYMSISGYADNRSVCAGPLVITNGAILTDTLGNVIYWPIFMCLAGTQLLGRGYQVLLCPNTLAYGAEMTVPIDTGVTAKFRVAGIAGSDQLTYYKFAVRAD